MQAQSAAVPAILVGRRHPLIGFMSRVVGIMVGHGGSRVRDEGEIERPRDVDSAVITKAQGGDHSAFRVIVERYEEPLRVLAFQLLGDAEQMNDALQDTFVKAYAGLPRYRADAALGTWLHRICYRVCVDYLRTRKRSPVLEQLDDDLADPADEAAQLALSSQLRAGLATLPPEQRAVLLLVDREGYDYATVAEVMGVPVGTVASRLSLARAAMRQKLGPALEREAR